MTLPDKSQNSWLTSKQSAFLAAWDNARDNEPQAFPSRASINPSRFAPFMSWMMIAEWRENAGTMFPLYTGSKLDAMMGQELTGKLPKDVLAAQKHLVIHQKVIAFLFDARVGVVVDGMARKPSGKAVKLSQMRLPLISDSRRGVVSFFAADATSGENNQDEQIQLVINDIRVVDIGFGAPVFPG